MSNICSNYLLNNMDKEKTSLFNNFTQQRDQLLISLGRREISWGKFVSKRIEMSNAYEANVNIIDQNNQQERLMLMQQLNNSNANLNNLIGQMRAFQQPVNPMPYQIIQNHQNSRPINTNCTTNYSSTNCTSY